MTERSTEKCALYLYLNAVFVFLWEFREVSAANGAELPAGREIDVPVAFEPVGQRDPGRLVQV